MLSKNTGILVPSKNLYRFLKIEWRIMLKRQCKWESLLIICIYLANVLRSCKGILINSYKPSLSSPFTKTLKYSNVLSLNVNNSLFHSIPWNYTTLWLIDFLNFISYVAIYRNIKYLKIWNLFYQNPVDLSTFMINDEVA